jgi:hypothetical protein
MPPRGRELEWAHLGRDEGVAGSNPATPIMFSSQNGIVGA